MDKIITEISPLSEKDCFYLIDKLMDRFAYPVHRHEDYELCFISNGAGARRIVGDSTETIGDYDLVLVGKGIEHGWEQHECDSDKIREITIQFSRDLFGDTLLGKTQLAPIRHILEDSSSGIAFGPTAILRAFNRLEKLTQIEVGFYRMLQLMAILHELAVSGDYYKLSSSPASASPRTVTDSLRVKNAQEYIVAHYKEEIRLADLARLAGMTPTAFSRFFKLRTGYSISDFLIDIRLVHATRALVDTNASVAEICYECGFNNVSNFNRIFKKKKGNSPKAFRDIYQNHKTLV